MRVIFTRNTKAGEGGPFRRGDVVDLAAPSLQRWRRRGAIEEYVEPATASKPEPLPARKPRRTTQRKPRQTEE